MVKLGSLADFQEGYVNPSQREPAYFDGPIKWLRATDLNDSVVADTTRTLSDKGFKSAGKSALLFEPGTLAISKSGTIGRLGILGDYMCGNRAVINIKPKQNAIPRYIFFVLRHLRPTIETLAEGSVQKNLYVSTLSNLDVPAPPKEVQQAFADMLGVLDDRITLLRETNATLEAIAQALFKSWFVDFDPVRAKIAGRAPEGMDEATAALFPDELEETELGVVPKGWKLVPFGELLSHTIGGDWGSDAPDEKNDTRVAIIRGTDIPDLQSGGANRVPVRYTSAKKWPRAQSRTATSSWKFQVVAKISPQVDRST
jgi:type I restriction enzyme, S subunit